MDTEPLRVLVVGGDTAAWLGLSTALGGRASQIFVPKDIDVVGLAAAAADIDVVVLVAPPDGNGAVAALELLREAAVAHKTVVIADADDHLTTAEALISDVAAFVLRGSGSDKVASAITQVADGGLFYDFPVASKLRNPAKVRRGGTPDLSAARALASALELKDSYTGGHAERVGSLAMRLAQAAALDDAVPDETLEIAFLLHDVGKIGIPESILGKPGGLTDNEQRVLQTHPILGERIVAPLGFPQDVHNVIRHHHERWDGSGYPDRLSGFDIPAAARIFSIADSIDAMTSMRPYRTACSFEEAMGEIMRNAGSQFDPALCALAEETFLAVPLELLAPQAAFDF